MDADQRLATYGSLAPGRPNHHQLAGLDGRWFGGYVHGRLVDHGWGAALGFPALVLDARGPAVDVQVFESADLPAHWRRLDAFEGPGYRRVETVVRTPGGEVSASVYVMNDVDGVTSELVAREPLFHRREWGTTRADFERATSPDYWEVGASGARYDRESVWSVLAHRYASGEPDAWESGTWSVGDVACRPLAGEVYLLTYRLAQGDRLTRRATVWERHDGGWRALYHQGTIES